MSTRHEIRCINKTNRFDPDERIENIGGVGGDGARWKISQPEALKGIEDGRWSFYVRKNGRTVNVIVAESRFGNKYLKTEADGEQPNNLLSLPECP